jgi:hypothetical protein
MNPFDAIATFVVGKIRDGIFQAWARYLFELTLSALISFLFVGGTVLTATRSWPVGIGSGMVSAALSMTYLFRRERSSLTKGMLLVLPAKEAQAEISNDFQTIQKPEK